MRRSTIRLFAFAILVVLAAPVAMHVITHDLHDHAEEFRTLRYTARNAHGNHEHPIIASAPQKTPSVLGGPISLVVVQTVVSSRMGITSAERNVLSLGALRIDNDVGLQGLLSTFLI